MRLFIVDRSVIMREKLLIDLAGLEGVEWVGMAEQPVPSSEDLFMLRPDAVLLSIDGADARHLRFVRSLKKMRSAPIVIVLTNAPSAECRDAFMRFGADFFLDKSYDLDKIPAVLGLVRPRARSYQMTAIPVTDEEEGLAEGAYVNPLPVQRKHTLHNPTKPRAIVLHEAVGSSGLHAEKPMLYCC